HGRRELAEGAPHEILGSLRAARVRGALDQLPRLLHEPSDGGRDALPAARLEVEARRQARGDGVVAERVVAAPAGARARVHRAAVPVVAGAGRAGGALGRHRRGGAAGRARGRRAARRARRGGHRRGRRAGRAARRQGAVAAAAARDVVAVRGAAVAGAVAAWAVSLGATGSAAVAPADAGRCAEVALLVRPDQAVAAAFGPALARVEGAVGATGERAAAEAERDAGGAAEVRAVAVLARLDAGHGATGGGARTFARASRGHAHLAGPRTRAAAVAVLERLDLAVAARGAWREGRVREQRERWLEDGIGRDALVDAVGERARAVGQRRDGGERLDREPLVRDDAQLPRMPRAPAIDDQRRARLEGDVAAVQPHVAAEAVVLERPGPHLRAVHDAERAPRVARCALRPAPARRAAVETLPRARGGEGEDARIGAEAGGDPVGLDGTPAHDDVARARGEEDAAARGEGILVPAGHVDGGGGPRPVDSHRAYSLEADHTPRRLVAARPHRAVEVDARRAEPDRPP